MEPARRAWIRIGLAEGLGPRTWGPLVERLGGPERLAAAPAGALARHLGHGRAQRVVRALRAADVEGVAEDAAALGQALLTPADPDWPAARFEALADPPVLLFRRGPLPDAAMPCAALVGTREASGYGLEQARAIATDLARRSVCVVSGFARGVDAAAHGGALAGDGHTLAVLGTGLDVDYPAAHADLRAALLDSGGTLLAEHPPGTRPQRYHFPRRNRLVAALADVVLVVEAPKKSGALITAGLAADMGRPLLAVPGHVRRATQRGCHWLIRQGAGLCESADDVLEALALEPLGASTEAFAEPDPGPAYDVWRHLDLDVAKDLDGLAMETGLPPAGLLSALAELELAGFATRVPGIGYLRKASDQ